MIENFTENWKVDFWVDAYAVAFDAYFLPVHISEDTGVDEKIISLRLQKLVEDKKLVCIKDVACPQCFTYAVSEEYRRFVNRNFGVNPVWMH